MTFLLIFFFFKFYLVIEDENITEKKTNMNLQNTGSENSIIKGLVYEVNFDRNKKYLINSNYNKIEYIDSEEIVNMREVTAVFVDENNLTITINSDEAIYNNSTYNTVFKENVKINYQNNIIESDFLSLDTKKNEIYISKDVKYFNEYGKMIADEIKIDLISEEILIYMMDASKKVKFISK